MREGNGVSSSLLPTPSPEWPFKNLSQVPSDGVILSHRTECAFFTGTCRPSCPLSSSYSGFVLVLENPRARGRPHARCCLCTELFSLVQTVSCLTRYCDSGLCSKGTSKPSSNTLSTPHSLLPFTLLCFSLDYALHLQWGGLRPAPPGFIVWLTTVWLPGRRFSSSIKWEWHRLCYGPLRGLHLTRKVPNRSWHTE